MTSNLRLLILSFLLVGIIAACNKAEPLYDLSDSSYQLLNADSNSVTFPDDYTGKISVISFIYTNCPDVCSVITANMTNIQKQLEDTSGINFIEVSFDPERDRPSVLKNYKELYGLNDQFSLLTGDTVTVNRLLEKLEIKAVKTFPDSTKKDSSHYTMRHSNKIYLMDEQGYIRAEYPASVVPPKNVIEDINTIRDE